MTNAVELYKFDNHSVRTVQEGEQVLFCAKDVAEALGYRDTVNAIKQHCKGVAKYHPISDSLGREQQARFIAEGDVYRLIASSKLPSAVRFERWLFDEVVPTIRRTGGYIPQGETPEETMARAVLIAQKTIEQQRRQLAAQAPKVLFADAVSASDGTCLVGELAKMITQSFKDHGDSYSIGQNRMFARLRDDGYLGTTGQNKNVPKQRYIEQGLFRIKETTIVHSDGHVSLNRTTKITGKGQTYFLRKYGPASGITRELLGDCKEGE